MENIIKIDNLYFQYPHGEDEEPKLAIKGVSLEIEEGSFTAIIGQNGSGKSTLAKNLLPSHGAVYVSGMDTRDEDKIWDIRQTAGMVFQNPDNQLVSAIVEDDVAFGPENIGIDPVEIRARVDEALDAVKMGKYKRKAPHLLSGGQKQRIAIAGVVAIRPRCIIFDEPTAMLDPRGRKDIMEIIEKLHREGITVILITHFMDEAVKADRVVIMNKGEILLDGTPEHVFSQDELIRSARLDVPMAAEIAIYLRENGIDVPPEVVTAERLKEFVCQYK